MAVALSTSDPNSYSESDRCEITFLDWDVAVNFNNHTIGGFAHLTVRRKCEDLDTLVLDVRDITVEKTFLTDSGKECLFEISNPANVNFGSKLSIKLGMVPDESFKISIKYTTSSEASALQWLSPEQTAGKRQPYLFSQCQAIHARSLFPCQDSPAVKFRYTAKVKCPRDITVLMSAEREGTEPCPDDASQIVHKFSLKVPIPSYLVAIVAGDLESRDIGPRSKVWSERELVDISAHEFAETEQMLQTAEQLGGPYVWGIYDLLVLPPSFPYGGMENPCLTFVTPTLLAGDRSLADVIAHEISHSWTGNLVTNRTFEHFWLNEGHTMFLERKIVGRMHGNNLKRIHASEGWTALQDTVKALCEAGDEPYTRLVPDLRGVDPDDAFSSVPYEKGFALLYHLEQLLGGPGLGHVVRVPNIKFERDWKDFLFEYFSSEEDQQKLHGVDWETWFQGLGMPPFQPDYDGALLLEEASKVLSARWVSQPEENLGVFSREDLDNLPSLLVRQFLQFLLDEEKNPLSLVKVMRMEQVYGFNAVKNSEVRFRWLRLCIKARWVDCIALALGFVTEQGRMKFVRPIYRDLYAWEEARSQAILNFNRVRREMHSTTAMLVAKDLHLDE
ncbi:leukotriene A-4 hydrolase [Elysia marginata]|uniref:Leukotriene A-4 hydrolase n=1 Tax=Elysia marginata TaxID=1093978 RepID=A0AAV4JZL4_9GAST|nr:leukotriene A-4 hydrolase [Elysia marginata]